MRLAALLSIVAGLAGCIALPDIKDGVTAEAEAAEYPVFGPRDALISEIEANQSDEATERAALEARVSSLEARAAALQGSVITQGEKDRLDRIRP